MIYSTEHIKGVALKSISSLYLHFPYCGHLCNYCDFYKNVFNDPQNSLKSYHRYLDESWTKLNQFLVDYNLEVNPIETLYLGGGTPSLWGEEGVDYLEQFFIKHRLEKAAKREFTLEVNPKRVKNSEILRWKEFGVNRFSVGIQSMRSEDLLWLDRDHTLEDAHNTLAFFKNEGFNYSVDLMLGLPRNGGAKRNIVEEIDRLLEYNPSHFSVYILTTKSHYKWASLIPSDEIIEQEYLKTSEYLKSKGFEHYEVSNYSLPGLESKHNLKYWSEQSVLALGPSATGFVNLNQGPESLSTAGIRFKWKINEPVMSIENLNTEQIMLERVYLSLRTNKGINLSHLPFFRENEGDLTEAVARWEKKGLLNESKINKIVLSTKGLLLMDTVMDDLFRIIPGNWV